MKDYLKSKTPYLIVLAIFFLLPYFYFTPLLEGKKLDQHDINVFTGMSREIVEHREATGEETYWTNTMFAGMPAYFSGARLKGNLIDKISNVLTPGPRPASYLFLMFLGFFLLLRAYDVEKWVATAGALAFGFSTYTFIILAAGHNSKVVAIAFMPALFAAIVYAFRKKPFTGALLFALALALEINANHLQITYYALLAVLILGLVYLVQAVRKKELMPFLKTLSLLAVAAILAVGANYNRIYHTYEMGKYSIRGESELKSTEEKSSDGLDPDYITGWSLGIDETATLFIPNFKGGSTVGELDTDSHFYQALRRNNVQNPRQYIRQVPLYWGDQPGTSPPYVGAVVIFLFVLGLIVLKGPEKWWIAGATLLSLLLSWGHNFAFLTDFFIKHVPGYNKFRAVTMILVIAQMTIPLLGFLIVKEIYTQRIKLPELSKAMKWAAGITGGFALLVLLMPSLAGTFQGNNDQAFGSAPWLIEALQKDRMKMLRSDAFRSLFFVLAGAGMLLLMCRIKKKQYALLGLAALIIIDLWTVDRRFLDDENFTSKKRISEPYQASAADKMILQDPDPNFKVLNLAVSTFNDASTSYFHKSIGGYHGAKLQRFQDLIENALMPEMQAIQTGLQSVRSQEDLAQLFSGLPVMNMLNTKYVIYSPQQAPLFNPASLGNAWFVDNHIVAANADEEMALIRKFDPATIATIDKRYINKVSEYSPADSLSSIELSSYAPNELVYNYTATSNKLCIFSEIHYPLGWKVQIDGQEADHFRANYLLRGMVLPAGEHEVIFRFAPESIQKTALVSTGSTLFILLALITFLSYQLYIKRRKEASDAS